MSMLEKAARAMCVADGFDPDGLIAYAKSGHAVSRREWGIYLARARAALTALLEPSEAMAAAGADNLFAAANDDWSDDARVIWRAMIQAALDEKEG
jgi:hypothetical protein